jgi:alpha-mannosidase
MSKNRSHSSIITLLFLFLSPPTLLSQTQVDRLVTALDSLSMASVNSWRISPDLKSYSPKGDPTSASFDDSDWKTCSLDENFYVDSCWIRKEVVLPEKILGTPLAGPMRFLLSVDDLGALWVNGESKGRFDWSGSFVLTNNAKPGERFLIVIKAINTGGPLRLINAEIQTEALRALRAKLENFSLSIRVGQKLLGFDTYQTNSMRKIDPGTDRSRMDRAEKQRLMQTLQSVAGAFDYRVIVNGPVSRFDELFSDVRRQLKPISEYAKRFTLYFDANAHIDAAWLWREKETIEVCNNTFRSVFNMMDARPDFTYTQSSALYYEWMERIYPDTFRKMQRRVKDGRWEITGGMWIEPDCNLPSGESWSRQLMYAKKYFRDKFDVDVKIGWNPDSFGYNGNMPMLYQQAGIDAFVTQKIGWNDTNVFPHRLFWWRSADSSRVLAYFPFDYVNEVKNPFQLVDWMRQFEANTGMMKMMVLFGVGDHGGGPSLDMMQRIDRLRELDVYPTVEYGNTTAYLGWLRSQDLTNIPEWNDELYLEYHQGTYTTQAATKEGNRTSEGLLTAAEKFGTMASLVGRAYDRSAMKDAWKHTMTNQFHDILPGSSIREVYIDAQARYDSVRAIGLHELSSSIDKLAASVDTRLVKKGKPVVVFNPLSWDRTDLVRLRLEQDDAAEYAVFDLTGKEIPSQTIRLDRYVREVMFIADKVPSLGYTTYELRKQQPAKGTPVLSANYTAMENEFFRITLDPEMGWVRSIIDKRSNREILAGNGNELQLLEDKPSAWDAWNIGLTGTQFPSTFRRIEIVELGPVRAILRLHRDYLKPGTKKSYPTEDFPSSFFTQDVILYAGLDRIDFSTTADWWEDKTMLKVAFNVNVHDSVATYEIPFGSVSRSTQSRDSWERAKVEVPALRWADISQDDYGVALLNDSKYGYDVKGSIIRLSLLRSPKWPDPTADRGSHVMNYSLYPHEGRWTKSHLVRRGYEINSPMIARMTNAHPGSQPTTKSFIRIEPANLVLTSVKMAEDSPEWIVQWYDAIGVKSSATVTLPSLIKTAMRSNFLEENGEALPTSKNSVLVETPKHGVVTIKVKF